MAKCAIFVSCLALFCVGTQSATLPRPAVVSKPQFKICNTPAFGSSKIPTPALSWEPELPPARFEVELNIIDRSRYLGKFDVWLNIVLNIARVAQNHWNAALPTKTTFPESHHIVLKTASSAIRPGYQVKSLIWTLRDAFRQYNRDSFYGSASIKTILDGKLLGLATMKGVDIAGNPSVPSTFSPSDPPLGRPGFNLRLNYLPNGEVFSDVVFFQQIIEMLVWAANHDPKSAAAGVAIGYSLAEDYTIRIEPLDYESTDDLPWEKMIEALGQMPGKMYAERRGGRWAELNGKIQVDGVNIGKFSILKGQSAECMGSNVTATS